MLMNYISATSAWFRMAWRIAAFILLILTLIYFVPVIAVQSVLHQPLSEQWVYILILVAISFIIMILDGTFTASIIFVVLHCVLSLAWFMGFGLFAKIYLHRGLARSERYNATNTVKMQVGTWVLLVDTAWWVAYAVYTTLTCMKVRRERKREMGLA